MIDRRSSARTHPADQTSTIQMTITAWLTEGVQPGHTRPTKHLQYRWQLQHNWQKEFSQDTPGRQNIYNTDDNYSIIDRRSSARTHPADQTSTIQMTITAWLTEWAQPGHTPPTKHNFLHINVTISGRMNCIHHSHNSMVSYFLC